MALSFYLLLYWSICISVSASLYVVAYSNNDLPIAADTASWDTSTTVGTATGGLSPANTVQPNPQTVDAVEASSITLALRKQHLRQQGRADVDLDGSRPADPPTLWLNSLDSLRCSQYSTVARGDNTCEGPEAWGRASDGTQGVFFATLGDTGLPADGLSSVSERLAAVCSALPVSFISLLGDNFYPAGVTDIHDSKFSTHFDVPFQHAALKRVAFFPVFGNHDYKTHPQAQIERYYSLCETCKQPQDWNTAKVRWRFPNPWYFSRLVYNNVPLDLSISLEANNTEQMQKLHNMAGHRGGGNSMTIINVHLDSNMLLKSPVYAQRQVDFLEKVLQTGVCGAAAAEADWVFVHQHHPLFTDATLVRNVKSFQDMLLPLFIRYGVDAVFAGHEHLLSQFELNMPGNHTGPVIQVISGSGSKLHKHNSHCCNRGIVGSCGSNVPLCPSKNCTFQKAIHGFALVELSMKQMRLYFIDAATGDVISRSTYASKKASRLSKASVKSRANGEDVGARARADAAGAYPAINRVLVPKELTGEWLSSGVQNIWILLMVVVLTALLCILYCRRCEMFQRCLSKENFRPNWNRWRRLRQFHRAGCAAYYTRGRALPFDPQDS